MRTRWFDWRGVLLCCAVMAGVLRSGLATSAVQASDHDFDAAVSALEQNYHVHRQHIPMIGLASFCAHVATHGAVQGIKIADFGEDSKLPADADMPEMLRDALGHSWSMVVTSRAREEQDAVYARPHGERMTLLIASYDRGDLSVVRLDMDAEHLRRWMRDPLQHARHPETN